MADFKWQIAKGEPESVVLTRLRDRVFFAEINLEGLIVRLEEFCAYEERNGTPSEEVLAVLSGIRNIAEQDNWIENEDDGYRIEDE